METIRKMVKMGDFFNSFQMLRFEGETQYRTFTGGIISIAIIITIIIAFASMILDTVNRITINYTLNSERNSSPLLSAINTSPAGKFMFGVEVWGYNLSSDYRYFDVVFNRIESHNGTNYTETATALEPCTREHWAMLPDVISKFDTLQVGNWLCPNIGTILKLQGKYSSETYHQLSVGLYPCNNATDPNRPCAPMEEITAYIESSDWNYFTFYYVNSVINADQPVYKSYFLEDRTFIVFGSKLGAELDMYLKQTDIISDNSIWPFQDIVYDAILSINFSPILYPFTVDNSSSYAIFYLMKDGAHETFTRTVQKIFVVFSFMGGLIGAIMACLFILNSYTSFAFELALAFEVFKKEMNQTNAKFVDNNLTFSLNLLHFAKYHFYRLLKKYTDKVDWPSYNYLYECRQQILEQLDIRNLIKRTIFLEYCVSFILQDFQLSQMQQEKPNIPREVRNLRHKIQSQACLREDELNSDGMSEAAPQLTGNPLFSGSTDVNQIFRKKSRQRHSISVTLTKQNEQKVDANMCQIIKGSMPNTFIIYDENLSSIRRKRDNLRRLKQSAESGNPVSKKLLQVITLEPEQQSTVSMDIKSKSPK